MYSCWRSVTGPAQRSDGSDRGCLLGTVIDPPIWRAGGTPTRTCAGRSRPTQSHLRRAGERTGLHFIPPGQPWRNGYIESFNSRVRDECRNINMFWSRARVVSSDWKADDNHHHRHSALGDQAPAIDAAARTHP